MPKSGLLSRSFSAKSRYFALNNSAGAAKAEFCQPYWGQPVQKTDSKTPLICQCFQFINIVGQRLL
ncbi:MAG TPA: hypothetical protein DF774_01585 [Rheinheimera sp.]|nr:hypothetical protein [Rheinheimera sp.]